jgi:hypothetical protein
MSFIRYVRVGKVELFLYWNSDKVGNRCYLGDDLDAFEVWVGPLYISINKGNYSPPHRCERLNKISSIAERRNF